jgi:catalase
MANTPKASIKTRKIAILVADGVDGDSLSQMMQTLTAEGARAKIIAPSGGSIKTAQGNEVKVDFTFLTAGSVLFDAVYVPDGEASATALRAEARALHFIEESFNHCKAIGASGAGVGLLRASALGGGRNGAGSSGDLLASDGVVVSEASGDGIAREFIKAVTQHRHWSRERGAKVPA